MAVESKYYIHESDLKARKALESIPAFSVVTKSFMDVMFERQFLITNMSSNVKLSEKQLPEYYDMLPPICEKLGIEVPDLYLDLDPVANAYTYGDKNPFIVMTTGLLDEMPMELIPTVLAHECGHIACHHTLYSTMGRFVLNGSTSLLSNSNAGALISISLQLAFFHWMRCSEFSADRAATIADGNADDIAEVCMRLSGYRKGACSELNVQEFINQAHEYREMVNDSSWNKTLEFYMLMNSSHPLSAVRALEATEWANSDTFKKILEGNLDDIEYADRNNLNGILSDKDSKTKLAVSLEINNLRAQLSKGKITQEEYYAKLNELLND